MARSIIFGEIEGIEEGRWFEGRKEMMLNSFHRNWPSVHRPCKPLSILSFCVIVVSAVS